MTPPTRPAVSIRFSAAEIAARVDVMAEELAAQLPPDTLVVSVLKGSFVFAADLIRALSRAGADWSMDFLTLSSYGTGTQTTGSVKVVRDIVDDVRGRDVLLVDDILEFGIHAVLCQEHGEGTRRASRLGVHPARQAAQAARRAQARLHRLRGGRRVPGRLWAGLGTPLPRPAFIGVVEKTG